MVEINFQRGLKRIWIICTTIILISTVVLATIEANNWIGIISVGMGLVLVGWLILFVGFWVADGFSPKND